MATKKKRVPALKRVEPIIEAQETIEDAPDDDWTEENTNIQPAREIEEVEPAELADRDVGIATLTDGGMPIFGITRASDGTFGWRTHGKMKIQGRLGPKLAYKFKKGFDDFEIATAAALCYYAKYYRVNDETLEVVAFFAPERKGLGGRRMVDSEEFAAAMKTTRKFSIPSAVTKALANA